MNRHVVTLQRGVNSTLAYISLRDLALAAFELLPLAKNVRVMEESDTSIRIRYSWLVGRRPKLLTAEEFDRFGLVYLEVAERSRSPIADTSSTMRSSKSSRNPSIHQTPPVPSADYRERAIDVEAVRAFWLANAQQLPCAHLFSGRELLASIAVGIEATLRNKPPIQIQSELRNCYGRLAGESIASWERVLAVAEFVFQHADLDAPGSEDMSHKRSVGEVATKVRKSVEPSSAVEHGYG
ncbi:MULTISPECIES: hypothetical protein [unclassified Lysobacter]|uniref:hypothetical protein n=1 Tax=unclassified Lysobacter TaxID=2635362 RepID=UPI001BE57EC0|nr:MULTISPECIES: hypothetical protein [unclassified Lysobacter]MBT2745833.1 hypothetical protein [Lysobacter sp. ISL-42]MBT2749608.1 hypothetical protein [Lysobacter sp. ISL-50]MBT2778748.1 hypothetical protein [Lysobacter sp. ISL-54]MBT2781343.1 hypothetical protein [Lysobacter sp. ISL-52]